MDSRKAGHAEPQDEDPVGGRPGGHDGGGRGRKVSLSFRVGVR